MEYSVNWSIDLDAESPVDAAKKALEIQRDRESLATHFIVRDQNGKEHEVDLWRGTGDDHETQNSIIHVSLEIYQGVIAEVRSFRNRASADSVEKEWLKEMNIKNSIDRQCKSDGGTEFLIFETELES